MKRGSAAEGGLREVEEMLLTVWRISVRKRGPSARVESFEDGKEPALEAAGRRRGLRRHRQRGLRPSEPIRRSNRSGQPVSYLITARMRARLLGQSGSSEFLRLRCVSASCSIAAIACTQAVS